MRNLEGVVKSNWLKYSKSLAKFLIILAAILQPRAARGQNAWQPVWSIGEFNQSSGEFLPEPAIKSVAPYVIGKSTPSKDWHAFQPGSGNGEFRHQPHPVSVEFNLGEKPTGFFRMKIALLVEHPRISALDVSINGHTGRFYQHPKLNYNAGDITCVFFPEYSSDTISFDLPARFFVKGTNHLVLTAIDEPSPGDQPSSDGTPAGDSGVVYDALELEHRTGGANPSSRISASIEPTIYYRSQEGQLKEMINVFVRYHEQPQRGNVKLEIKAHTYVQALPTDRAFGELKAQFAVPEFEATTLGKVTVDLNNHRSDFSQDLTPGRKWTFYVVPNEHLDVGYTDYQAKVAEVHARVIDEAMELIAKNPNFRYSVDGYWEIQQYLDTRTKAQKEKLFRMMAERKILVPAQDSSLLTGFPTAETLIRSLYPSYHLSQEVNGPFDYASITDVPSYTWSYASVLAAAGLMYFIAASDNYRGPILLLGHLNEKSPFWWEGPDGGKVMMWYSRHYHQVLTLFGMPPRWLQGTTRFPSSCRCMSTPPTNPMR
jgi:alpha-mannosidase